MILREFYLTILYLIKAEYDVAQQANSMECSNELSVLIAVQHTYVALLSVPRTCQDIPNFHWNAHIFTTSSTGM